MFDTLAEHENLASFDYMKLLDCPLHFVIYLDKMIR